MRKNVSFEKRIDFPTMVGEISAISLEEDLKFINESSIEGNLILSGKYKLTEASRLEEDFNYKLPIEISLTEKLDISTSKVEISNFTYKMMDENIMLCNIELLIEGLELLDESRECDSDVSEIEIPIKEDIDKVINNEFINDTDTLESDVLLKENNEVKYDKRDDIVVTKKEVAETIDINKDDKVENTSIFNINEDSETYGTLLVYIVRENETINSIITKYNTTIEELEKYNDLKDLSIGTKLIIPLVNEWCYK